MTPLNLKHTSEHASASNDDKHNVVSYHRPRVRGWSWWARVQKYPCRVGSGLVGLVLLFVVFGLFSAPRAFPVGSVVSIEEGATLMQVSDQFKEQGVIRSRVLLSVLVRLLGSERGVIAGDYFFSKRRSPLAIAQRISHGDYGLEPIRVTIPEGATSFEIATLFADQFTTFDADEFIRRAQPKEGRLFPDTYFFLSNVREAEVVRVLEANFEKKIATLTDELALFGHSLDEVVIMASILEKEAWKYDDRRRIAGVLWNRLNIGMPLQVDAAFLYINGKNTYTLTKEDLKDESPYNTYVHKGLPIGAIANPSLEALQAAITPVETDYLFYLADRSGNTYYAETFEGHKRNRVLYLNK